MFISYYTIIYFFVKNFFSNVYISVNTIFECSYLSFGWEIGHPLSMSVTRGMEGGHPKCLQMRTGGEGYHWGYFAVQFSIIRLFFTWVLCIYIILDKVCHILYTFGLNSTVCSHIVGVHLSSDQVTYYFMMDADLYNSFLLRLLI